MAERTLNTKIQLRNDTAAKWTSVNPKLLKGEIGIEIDTRKIKIGDGTNKWNALSYANITDLSNYYSKDEIDDITRVIEDSVDNINVALTTHTTATNNPHKVTASQVGLGSVLNVPSYSKTETDNLLDDKVDKVSGKSLVSDTEITKLATVEQNANYYVLPTAVVQDSYYVHTDNNYSDTDKSNVASNTSARHTHSNKTLLDTYDQTNANIKAAITNKHTHSNKTILDNTTASFTTADKTALDGATTHIANKNNPHGVTAAQIGTYQSVTIDEKLDEKLNANLKGVANGVAELDENTKIKLSQLPDVVLGQLVYGGNVKSNGDSVIATLTSLAKTKLGVSTGTITLQDHEDQIQANEGIFYIATNSFTLAGISFATGDWLISTGLEWTKVDNSDAVTGVKGSSESSYRTGNVNITKANIGLGNVLNVASYSKSEVDTQIGSLTNNISGLQQEIQTVSGGLESESTTRNQQIEAINTALEGKSDTDHTHAVASANKDGFMPSAMFSRILAVENASHTHSNKALLDTYNQTNANIALAVQQTHTHANIGVLNNTTAAFTSALKTKLDGIETGANKTVVDSAISTTSTNPVQNKVITAKFQDIDDAIDDIENRKLESTVIKLNGTCSFFNANGDFADGVTNITFKTEDWNKFSKYKYSDVLLTDSDFSGETHVFKNYGVTDHEDGSYYYGHYYYEYDAVKRYLLTIYWSSTDMYVDEYIPEKVEAIAPTDILILNCGKADLWNSED